MAAQSSPDSLVFEAASFAARVHRHGLRKDGQTPYVAHVYRVCMVVRQVFAIGDPAILAAALLHDSIEDTTTDYDDVAEEFGDQIAGWVATLSKDMRLPEAVRETSYLAALAAAGWQVHICKLADIYDNVSDSQSMPAKARAKTLQRARLYLDAFQSNIAVEAAPALAIVEARYAEMAEAHD